MNRFKQDLKTTVSAVVNPSEDPKKITDAIGLLFPSGNESDISVGGNLVQARFNGDAALKKVYDQVRIRRVLGAFRRLLRQRSTDRSTSFLINKQAATKGLVVLCDQESESPLGPILVQLETRSIQELIDWLAPPRQDEAKSSRQR